MKTRNPSVLLAWVVFCLGLRPLLAPAQYIQVRVSAKFILGPRGERPTGLWTNMNYWRQAIDVANAGNARHGRGFRYLYPTFDGDVSGFGQFYDLDSGEEVAFELAMQTNHPAQTHWRTDALNVYVVRTNLGSDGRGWAGSPETILAATVRSRVAVFGVNMGGNDPFTIMAHEFGHHHGLIHTFGGDDRVADTPVDVDPAACPAHDCTCMFTQSVAKALAEGWSLDTLRMMTNNLMSYHCDVLNDSDLSEGQLDRWADITRMYNATEDTGVTYFVHSGWPLPDPDGYSQSYRFHPVLYLPLGGPFPTVGSAVAAANPAGGDVIIVRPGHFNEQLTIQKRVTLRATRVGWVTIGKP